MYKSIKITQNSTALHSTQCRQFNVPTHKFYVRISHHSFSIASKILFIINVTLSYTWYVRPRTAVHNK